MDWRLNGEVGGEIQEILKFDKDNAGYVRIARQRKRRRCSCGSRHRVQRF